MLSEVVSPINDSENRCVSGFEFKNGTLFCEEVDIPLLSNRFGTPLYVYSAGVIGENCRAYRHAFKHSKICYAVKANSNIHILKRILSEDLGMDVVSRGEIECALRAKASPQEIIFSGVGKTDEELRRAIEVGVFCINVESDFEMARLDHLVKTIDSSVRLSIRINPNIDVNTIPYIATGLYENKFGIAESALEQCLQIIKKNPRLQLIGVGCHLGSQICEVQPYRLAAKRLVELGSRLVDSGFSIQWIDCGGGLGVRYMDENPPSIAEVAGAICEEVGDRFGVIVEPGRSIVAESAILVTGVLGIKETPKRKFCVVDAGMNDFIRPSLYGATHSIVSVQQQKSTGRFEVVGPVCETGDFLGTDVALGALKRGDLVALLGAGAYGMSMASNYNARLRPCEILVEGSNVKVIRQREQVSDLYSD